MAVHLNKRSHRIVTISTDYKNDNASTGYLGNKDNNEWNNETENLCFGFFSISKFSLILKKSSEGNN